MGTEAIVRAAGMTRGALYHQFANKTELFPAVYEEIESDIVPPQPIAPLAHVLIGPLDEAALYVATADNPGVATEEMRAVLTRVIAGIAQP